MRKLKQYFKAKDSKTQYAVAKELGLHRSAITHWVLGRHKPAARHLARLSEITGIRVEDLL